MSSPLPLQPLSTNTLSSCPSSLASSSTPRNVKLAPIFTRTYSRPRPTTSNGPASSPCPVREDEERWRKRAKLDVHAHLSSSHGMDLDDFADDDLPRGRLLNSIQDYFVTTPLRAEGYSPEVNPKNALKMARQDLEMREEGVWRRRRGRNIRQRATMTVCPEGESYQLRVVSAPCRQGLRDSCHSDHPVPLHTGHATLTRCSTTAFAPLNTLVTSLALAPRLCSPARRGLLALCQVAFSRFR